MGTFGEVALKPWVMLRSLAQGLCSAGIKVLLEVCREEPGKVRKLRGAEASLGMFSIPRVT